MKRFLLTALILIFSTMSVNAGAAEESLGAGDTLRISVYANPDLTLETKISDAGKINYPLIGDVELNGLTPSDAEKKIAGLLESGGFVRKPQVNIIVTLMQSQQVSVLGQVNRPGRYPVDGKRSLTDVLALAGGMNADGADQVTLIRTRGGKTTRETVDLVGMMQSGDFSKNYELSGNDVVYVERASRFYIYGEVQRPGAYRLEKGMTVLQALATGGGLTQRGTERGVRIKRRTAEGAMKIFAAKHDDTLQTDDVVYVQESLF